MAATLSWCSGRDDGGAEQIGEVLADEVVGEDAAGRDGFAGLAGRRETARAQHVDDVVSGHGPEEAREVVHAGRPFVLLVDEVRLHDDAAAGEELTGLLRASGLFLGPAEHLLEPVLQPRAVACDELLLVAIRSAADAGSSNCGAGTSP